MSYNGALGVCRAWVEAVHPTVTVVYESPATADAPRPDLPYVTVAVTAWRTLTPTGLTYTTDAQTGQAPYDYATRRYVRGRWTVRVSAWGSTDLLTTAVMALYRHDVASVVRDAGYLIRPAGDILITHEMRSTVWEPSEGVDMHVWDGLRDDHTGAVIESVDAAISF